MLGIDAFKGQEELDPYRIEHLAKTLLKAQVQYSALPSAVQSWASARAQNLALSCRRKEGKEAMI